MVFSLFSIIKIFFLFWSYSYLTLLKYEYIKGIKNGCPCFVEIRGTQGCALVRDPARTICQCSSHGTTLSASDIHNVRATIFNPFYDIECKIIKKILHNKTWIEADIPCINITPNQYNALTQPLSTSAMTSQSHSNTWRHNNNTKKLTVSARERDQNRFEIYGSRVKYSFISSCTRAKPWIFDSVYMKGNRMKLFQ